MRPPSRSSGVPCLLPLLLVAAPGAAEVAATRAQLRDAWLSVDVVVLATYDGVDSTLGPAYHACSVREAWLGSVKPGRLLFKAPRGVDAAPGDETLFMLWERLNGATDSYLENSRERLGDAAWAAIGPDSIAAHLLPFARYAFPFQDRKLTLRGTGPFLEKIKQGDLRREFLELEYSLLPAQLFARSDLVLQARVERVDKRRRVIEGVAVEYRVVADFSIVEMWKGERPDSLRLDYSSFPRSPRFDAGEEVILFLVRRDGELILEPGKRAVYHVRDGTVGETGQPLRQFFGSLSGPRR